MSREIEVTEENWEELIEDGVTLVDFWAPWCGPCRLQGPIIDKLASEVGESAKVGKCNVDDQVTLAQRLGVMSIPTLIIFKDGEEVDRMTGLQTHSVLVQRLNRSAA